MNDLEKDLDSVVSHLEDHFKAVDRVVRIVKISILTIVVLAIIAITMAFFSQSAKADQHEQFFKSTSYSKVRVLWSESAFLERNRVLLDNKQREDSSQTWIGGGIATRLGLELYRFIQFDIGHHFVNIQNQDTASIGMRGFRVSAGMKLIFASPMVNLEFGAGYFGSKFDTQVDSSVGSFAGDGQYFVGGISRYVTPRLVASMQLLQANEKLLHQAGECSDTAKITGKLSDVELGVRFVF